MLKQTQPDRMRTAIELESRREWHAGLLALIFAGVILASTMVVEVMSYITEVERDRAELFWGQMLGGEISSRVVLLALFPGLIKLVIALPLTTDSWLRRLPFYLTAMTIYSALHVLLMVLMRKGFTPLLFDFPYKFVAAGQSLSTNFFYEFRKDIVTFWLFVSLVYGFKHMSDLRQELAAAKREARQHNRVTLKCGGRSIFLDAQNVEWANAAGNYVEIGTDGKTHLARITLSALEQQLTLAGADIVRVHRSWLVNRSAISEIRNSSGGDQQAIMHSGLTVPVSRRFRDQLHQDTKAAQLS